MMSRLQRATSSGLPATFLVISIISVIFPYVASISVLLIGDSVDRYIATDWCYLMGIRNDGLSDTAWDNLWGSGNLKYGRGLKFPTYICGDRKTNDTVAFVHHYGSPDRGPYYNGFANNPGDPNIDSILRIPYALDLYLKEYPLPDRIMYHSALWDAAALTTIAHLDFEQINIAGTPLYDQAVSSYSRNINSRIDQLIDLATKYSVQYNKTVEIALRTAPSNPAKRDYFSKDPIQTMGPLLHAFNTVMRNISSARNLTLFDLDKDTWSHIQFNYSRNHEIMRDYVHPNAMVTGPAGSKILGTNYSRYFHYHGPVADTVPRVWLGGTGQIGEVEPKRKSLVLAVRYEPDLLGFHHHHNEWINVLSNQSVIHENVITEQNAAEVHMLSYSSCGLQLLSNTSFAYMDARHLGITSVLPIKRMSQMDNMAAKSASSIVSAVSPIVFNESDKKMYLLSGVIAHEIPPLTDLAFIINCSAFGLKHLSLERAFTPRVIHQSDCTRLFDSYRLGRSLPDIFHENALYRASNERAVYLVRNGTRHMVYSANAFMKLGFDFADVSVIDPVDARYAPCLPLGHDIM
jgi:hypothetical protein